MRPSRLAIEGGDPACAQSPPPWPVFDGEEERALLEVCRSGAWWLPSAGQGRSLEGTGLVSQVVEFQREFAAFHGVRHAVAASSCTAALEAAVRALGCEPGDEIIVPAYSFVATATCALQNNLVPIFVDIDPATYNLDPSRLEEAITPRTRAILPVHFAGQIADMEAVMAIARRHGLAVIEDAAHAHGAERNGLKAGSLGTAAAFSFQGSKNMTAGEGGALLSNDESFAERFESLIWAGRDLDGQWYETHRLGWNSRLTEFQAALLRVQLGRLASQNAKRERSALHLNAMLRDIEGLSPLERDPQSTVRSHHLYVLRFDEAAMGVSRRAFLEALCAEGVPAFPGYEIPLYKNPMFARLRFINGAFPTASPYHDPVAYAAFADRCPAAEAACAREAIWMTHNVLLGDENYLSALAEGVRKVVANIARLR